MSIVSCQQVTIDHNEIGLIFKRFGGGASSSYKLEAGSYTIPKWNRVIIYNTALDSNSIDIVNEDLNYTISFSYHLDKKKMFFYHNYYGGDPATYAERAVKGVVMKESIEKLLCMSTSIRFVLFENALGNYFLDLDELEVCPGDVLCTVLWESYSSQVNRSRIQFQKITSSDSIRWCNAS